eukprot:scaffold10540_cov116-Isochrysis_galbana.AAC.7
MIVQSYQQCPHAQIDAGRIEGRSERPAALFYFLRCLRGGLGTREEETGGDRQPVDSAWEL